MVSYAVTKQPDAKMHLQWKHITVNYISVHIFALTVLNGIETLS